MNVALHAFQYCNTRMYPKYKTMQMYSATLCNESTATVLWPVLYSGTVML